MRKSNARIEIPGWSLLLLSACLLSGCATMPSARPLPAQAKEWKKVALVEEMILPPSLPTVPLLQAGIYRGAFSGIEADVVKLHQDRIDEYEEILGQQLSKSSPFTVLYGKELLKVKAFKNMDPATVVTFETTAAGRGDDSMVIPTRGYNFFDFTMDGVNPKKVFGANESPFLDAHAGSLAALCKSLDVDSIVVAQFYIDTPGVNFLALGQKNLTLTVAFFDRDGKLIQSGTARLRGINSSGGDLDAYTKTMDKYPELVGRLVQSLTMGLKKTGGE